jgi:hypothetical protein
MARGIYRPSRPFLFRQTVQTEQQLYKTEERNNTEEFTIKKKMKRLITDKLA